MRRSTAHSKRRWLWLAAATAIPAIAQAQPKVWIGGSGNWSTPTNWNPPGQPGAADTVQLFQNSANVTYDVSAGSSSVVSVAIDNGSTLSQVSTNPLNISQTLNIAGSGGAFMQSGLLSAGTLTLSAADMPGAMLPTLTQLGGTINVNTFNSGSIAGSTILTGGTLSMSAGSINAVDTFHYGGWTTIEQNAHFTTTDLQFSGGTFVIGGNNSGGTLTIGTGGMVFGGNEINPPRIYIISGTNSSIAPRIELGGDVTFNGLAGTAQILAYNIGAFTPIMDLEGGNRTFNVTHGLDGDLQIGVNMRNGAITKNGNGYLSLGYMDNTMGSITVNAGTLSVGTSNDFVGTVTLNGGTLQIFADAALGNSSNRVLFQGGALEVSGSTGTSRVLSVGSAGGTIDVDANGTFSITSPLIGGGLLNKTGAGMLQFAVTSTYVGALTIKQGGLQFIGPQGSLPLVNSISLAPTSTLSLDDSLQGLPGAATGRINDFATLFVDGGTLSIVGATNQNTSETIAGLMPRSGGSTIKELPNGTGTTSLIVTNGNSFPNRGFGATLEYFALPSGIGNSSKVILQGFMPVGFVGGWATVNDNSFAAYNLVNPGNPSAGVYLSTFTGETSTFVSGGFVHPVASFSTVGTLSINTLHLSGSQSVTIQNNKILNFATNGLLVEPGASASINGGSINANGELDVTVGVNGSINISSGIIDNNSTTVSLIKAGAGTLVLGSGPSDFTANSYSGITEVHNGTLDLNKAPGTNAIPGDLLIDGGEVLLHSDEQIIDSSNVTITAGTLDLNGHIETIQNFTNTGGTLLTGGGLLLITSPHTTVFAGGTNTVNSAGSLTANALLVSGGANTVEAGGILNVGTAGLTLSGNASPAIQMNASSSAASGLMTLAGDVSFTGTSGTAYLRSGPTTDGQISGVLNLLGGTRTLTVNDGSAAVDLEISATIVSGALIKSGSGLLRLTASNNYAGGTTINSGTIEVVSTSGLGIGPVTFAGGFLSLKSDDPEADIMLPLTASSSTVSTTVTLDRAFTRSTTGTFVMGAATLGSRLNLSGSTGGTLIVPSITLTANAVINNSVAMQTSLVQEMAPNCSLEKMGAGKLTLAGIDQPYSYSGQTIVDAGTLELANPVGVTVPQSLIVNGPGVVRLLSPNQIAPAASITLNGALAAPLLDLNGFANTVGSVSFVAGGAITTGTGMLMLNGDVTTSGLTGAATITGNLNLGNNSSRTFSVANGTATDDLAITGAISGNTALIKTGTGQLHLSGTSSFTGGATLQAGTILCTGSASWNPFITTPGTNITGGALVLNYSGNSPAGTIQPLLKTAFQSGYNVGPLRSTTATSRRGLGWFDDGASRLSILYTYFGDSTLDGLVNSSDFTVLAQNFGKTGMNWQAGDFNYDGVVNLLDFNALASNFGQTVSAPALAGTLVPEPAALALLLPILGRRRRKS